jgi:hypothetical protein
MQQSRPRLSRPAEADARPSRSQPQNSRLVPCAVDQPSVSGRVAGRRRSGAADSSAGLRGNRPRVAAVYRGEGRLARTSNFRRAVGWSQAVKRCGLPDGFHFHHLRHAGNNLAAAAGVSTRELMHRMGHSSMRAALIYQHATNDRDREIALGIDARLAMRQDLAREWPAESGPASAANEEASGSGP